MEDVEALLTSGGDAHALLDARLLAQTTLPLPTPPSASPRAALTAALGQGRSPMCGKVFKEGDLAYNCRDCQVDPTCVLCQECFQNSDHTGHEVHFHLTSSGGCCDCGDEEAWNPAGFCSKHSVSKEERDAGPVAVLPPAVQAAAKGPLIPAAVAFVASVVSQLRGAYDVVPPPDTPGPWTVFIHNDDVHTYDDVTDSLTLFAALDANEAAVLTHQVDAQGQAEVVSGPAAATAPAAQGLRGRGLQVSVQDEALVRRLPAATAAVRWLLSLCDLSQGLGRVVCIALAGGSEADEHAPVVAPTSPPPPPPFASDPLLAPPPTASPPPAGDAGFWALGGGATGVLPDLLAATPYLTKPLATALKEMYLSVMKDAVFRRAFALAYTEVYTQLSVEYATGRGTAKQSLFDFGVHIFTVPTLVTHLVEHHNLLTVLLGNMEATLAAALPDGDADFCAQSPTPRLDPDHNAIAHKRYTHTFRDLEYVCRVRGVAAGVFQAPALLGAVIRSFAMMQGMDPRYHKTGDHVEFEPQTWMCAFNLALACAATLRIVTEGGVGRATDAAVLARCVDDCVAGVVEWTAALPASEAWTLRDVAVAAVGRTFAVPDYDIKRRPVSFHTPLNKLLAWVAAQVAVDTAWDPVAHLRGLPTTTVMAVVEYPLRCVVMASQIKLKQWARNGECVANEHHNYVTPPMCNGFRDLDMLSLALGCALLGGDHALVTVLARFGVLEWGTMAAPVLGGSAAAAAETTKVMDECLRALIMLVTELPMAELPDHGVDRARIRREVLHRLAVKPLPRSKLVQAAQLGWRAFGRAPEALVSAVVDDVAVYHPPTGMEDGTYHLKDAVFDEVDLYYHHLTVSQHVKARAAWEAKRAPGLPPPDALYAKARPPAAALPPAHPAFAPVRDMLTSHVSAAVVRGILRDAVGNVTLRTFDALVASALHWLGMALREWQPPAAAGSAAAAGAGADATPPAPAHTPRQDAFMAALCEEVEVEGTRGASGSVVTLLHALMRSQAAPAFARESAAWCLRTAAEAHPVARAAVEAVMGTAGGDDKSASRKADARKARMLAAQKKAMAAMARQQAAFLDGLGDTSSEEEGEEGEGEAGGGVGGAADGPPPAYVEPAPECILCQEAIDSPMCFLGFIGCTTAPAFVEGSSLAAARAGHGWVAEDPAAAGAAAGASGMGGASASACPVVPPSDKRVRVAPPTPPPTEKAVVSSYARFCGHAMHQSCWEQYWVSMVVKYAHQTGYDGLNAVDVLADEFVCPLCKSVCNTTVPYSAALWPPAAADSADGAWTGRLSGAGPRVEPTHAVRMAAVALGERSHADVVPILRRYAEGGLRQATLTADLQQYLSRPAEPSVLGVLAPAMAVVTVVNLGDTLVGTEPDADGLELRKPATDVVRYSRPMAGFLALPRGAPGGSLDAVAHAVGGLVRGEPPSGPGLEELWVFLTGGLAPATLPDCDPVAVLAVLRCFIASHADLVAAASDLAALTALKAASQTAAMSGGGDGSDPGAATRAAAGALGVTSPHVRGFPDGADPRVAAAVNLFCRQAAVVLAVTAGPSPDPTPPEEYARALASTAAAVLGGAPVSPTVSAVLAAWSKTAGGGGVVAALLGSPPDGLLPPPRRRRACLIPLPPTFDALFSTVSGRKCTVCDAVPADPAICLACGMLLCAGTACCKRRVGEVTAHMMACGGGSGLALLVRSSSVVLFRRNFAAFYPSPYVDPHGEQDIGLKRGRPLHLRRSRLQALEDLWASAGTDAVTSSVRLSSTSIIRHGWY